MGYGSDGLGNFRLVVFGEKDVATPDLVDSKAVSWTDVLCEELHCSTYLSFVPQESQAHSVVSIGLYAEGLDQAANFTEMRLGPGQDYGFQPDMYPVVWKLADLEKQVSSFLAIPKPETPPRETLWVFSFGTWDVWSLASLPLAISRPLVERMTEHIFDQAERLYQSALDENSIAWSGLSTDEETVNSTATGQGRRARETDMFRIMIPKLFDPSLTPGWANARPKLAEVHSKAEQMRNAFILTGEWNAHLQTKLSVWVNGPRLEDNKHDERVADLVDSLETNAGVTEYFEGVVAALQAAARTGQIKRRSATKKVPVRDGFLYDLPEYLLDAMADSQLRSVGLEDGNGIGANPRGESFGDVSKPCSAGSGRAEKGDSPTWSAKICEAVQDHLFSTPFTVAPRAIREVGLFAADMAKSNDTMRALWDARGMSPK
ncbi:hypothetical protein OQA88_2053 [Cercophora sp. LCS_1]